MAFADESFQEDPTEGQKDAAYRVAGIEGFHVVAVGTPCLAVARNEHVQHA